MTAITLASVLNTTSIGSKTRFGNKSWVASSSAPIAVAVNAAIVPEFGGSNLGVPAAEAMQLLEAAAATSP